VEEIRQRISGAGLAAAARATDGYDSHQRVVVRSQIPECPRMNRIQRRARYEVLCEERVVGGR
jgi:hypothetical protein